MGLPRILFWRRRSKGLPNLKQQSQTTTTNNNNPKGKRTKCSRLDGPSCVLIGDAAHSVTPVFGQVRVWGEWGGGLLSEALTVGVGGEWSWVEMGANRLAPTLPFCCQ